MSGVDYYVSIHIPIPQYILVIFLCVLLDEGNLKSSWVSSNSYAVIVERTQVAEIKIAKITMPGMSNYFPQISEKWKSENFIFELESFTLLEHTPINTFQFLKIVIRDEQIWIAKHWSSAHCQDRKQVYFKFCSTPRVIQG